MDDMPFYADDHFVGIQTHFMKIVALYDNLIILIKKKYMYYQRNIYSHLLHESRNVNTGQRH